ncbi:glycosyltransferase [Arthrobacter mobilis]|uniref:Glycosyltransferase family 4 protein n=1 Tax=Arthrobacter mobilis TaxID=2724944 RepID=A0A7X6HCB2_9MICC|nr:glycosyltransferase [Arthrobacter mobilis]NKX53850.1 glycosyltransferase family 4 protein [Arthrobacter mobilis]
MGGTDPKVLHLYDAADVGATLVRYGRRQHLPWRQFNTVPPADAALLPDPPNGPGRRARRLLAEAYWQAARAAGILRADLLHVHSGSRLGIVRSRPHRPFVLHFHGTDIRTQYYDPARRPVLQWGADHAAAVLYSTPDLRPHAQAARPDALYLPNPADLEELPAWAPAARPRVVFASRWDEAKGGAAQLDTAKALAAAAGPEVELQGLDWGGAAGEAAALGVKLLPRMPKPQYLRWLASAHCVIGQSAGILAMSELQAVAIGVPVAMPLGEGFYPGPSPVLRGSGPGELAAQAMAALADPAGTSAKLAGRAWVQAHHSPQQAVARLADLYRGLAGSRQR